MGCNPHRKSSCREKGIGVRSSNAEGLKEEETTLHNTGLPPTQQEIKDFWDDDSPDAFAKVADRLAERLPPVLLAVCGHLRRRCFEIRCQIIQSIQAGKSDPVVLPVDSFNHPPLN
jgi:hypothetical protein